jgi:WD40 repeat protein
LFVDLAKNELSQIGKIGDELSGNISFGANNSVALLWGNEASGMVTVGGDAVWYRPYDFEINPVMDAGIHPEIPAISFQESRLTKVGLYSLTHGNPVCEAFEQPAPINRFIFSPKERRAVTIGGDSRVLFWKIREGDPGRPARTYRRVSYFLQAHKAVRIAIADIRGLLCLIDPFEGTQVGPPVRSVRGLRSILLNEQDTVLVGFAWGALFLRWRLEGELAEPEGVRFGTEILFSSLAPDGSHNAVMLEDGSIQLVGLGKQLSIQGEIIHKTTGGRLSGFQYSHDGTLMTTWSNDGWIRIWDVRRTEEICSPIALQGIPYGALFDSGMKRLLAWGSDNVVTVKNIEADAEMQLKHFGPGVLLEPGIVQARFSKSGELVFSASSDKTIRVWDAEIGEQILPPFEHRALVGGFAQSYDDRTLLSWAYDRVSLWDLRTGKRAVKDIQHQDVVAFAFWTFSENRLVSVDQSNSIQVWDKETGLHRR